MSLTWLRDCAITWRYVPGKYIMLPTLERFATLYIFELKKKKSVTLGHNIHIKTSQHPG